MWPKLQTPSSTMLVGATNSGKTNLTLKILNNLDIYDKPIRKVQWYYNDPGSIPPSNVLPEGVDIKFINKLPAKFVNDSGEQLLVIIDDFMDEAMNSLAVSQLFTLHSHHSQISILCLVQNLFLKGKYSRTISLNTTYFIIFRNLRDQLQIQKFFIQMCPLNAKAIQDIYIDATKKPHGYILLDFSQRSHTLTRYRTDLFGETTVCYCPSKALKSSRISSSSSINREENDKDSCECNDNDEDEEEAVAETIECGQVYAIRLKK